MKPELIMLVGLPGCGKSTWIEHFLKKEASRQYSVISSDALIEQAAQECNVSYDVAHKLLISEVLPLVYDMADDCIKNECSLIWDQTNLSTALRRDKLKKIPLHWRRVCVVFDLPLEEIKRRRDQREATSPGKTVPEEIIKNMTASFEIPTKQEGWDEIIVINS